MVPWSEFAASAPDLARAGQELLAHGGGHVLLVTVRGEELPRVHPVTVAVVAGRLYVFVIDTSPKRLDLDEDGRYALHTPLDPYVPREFSLRGRARRIEDPARRASVASGWHFTVDDDYGLYELRIASALLGVRDSPDDWPPRYTSWKAPARPNT
jgi:hypothetical protein